MAKQNTVFISYRRTNAPLALNIYQYLTAQGYDVFYDIDSIRSGDWKQIILDNITSRAHFLIVLTPSAAERFSEAGDIMRLEIETAIDSKRNIVPLFMEEFKFPSVQQYLTGKLAVLPQYNGLDIPMRYFMYAMQDLVTKHLEQDINTIVHPASPKAEQYAYEQQREANKQAPVTQGTLSAQTYFERGWKKYQSGDYYGALDDYNQAIQIDPQYAIVYTNRGWLKHDKLADYQGALDDYNRGIQLGSQYALDYTNRGWLKHDKLGDYQGALHDYNLAIQLDPQYALAYNNRGWLKHDLLGDYQGALQDYNLAIQYDSQLILAYINRGTLMYNNLKDYQGAKADWERALQIDPHNITAKNNLKLVEPLF